MRGWPFLIVALVALAGCGEPEVSYPDDYLLQPGDAPDGLILLGPGMEGWDEFVEGTGATENPGRIQADLVTDLLGTPQVEEAHVAVYVTLTGGVLISVVVDLEGSDEAKDWLRDEVLDGCLEGARLLMDGDLLAGVLAFGIDPDMVDAAAGKVAKASKAGDLCHDAYGNALASATPLDRGENGPFETGWFTFQLQDGSIQVTSDVDVQVYDQDMRRIDVGGEATADAPGLYAVRATGSGFTITLEP